MSTNNNCEWAECVNIGYHNSTTLTAECQIIVPMNAHYPSFIQQQIIINNNHGIQRSQSTAFTNNLFSTQHQIYQQQINFNGNNNNMQHQPTQNKPLETQHDSTNQWIAAIATSRDTAKEKQGGKINARITIIKSVFERHFGFAVTNNCIDNIRMNTFNAMNAAIDVWPGIDESTSSKNYNEKSYISTALCSINRNLTVKWNVGFWQMFFAVINQIIHNTNQRIQFGAAIMRATVKLHRRQGSWQPLVPASVLISVLKDRTTDADAFRSTLDTVFNNQLDVSNLFKQEKQKNKKLSAKIFRKMILKKIDSIACNPFPKDKDIPVIVVDKKLMLKIKWASLTLTYGPVHSGTHSVDEQRYSPINNINNTTNNCDSMSSISISSPLPLPLVTIIPIFGQE